MTDDIDAIDKRITERLRSGEEVSDLQVSKELNCSRRRVLLVRNRLGIAPYGRGRRSPYPGIAAVIAAHSTEDRGHLLWTGPVHPHYGTPLATWRAERVSALRWVFIDHHGRDPEGYVKSSCGLRYCVRPEHLADRAMRKAARQA